MRKVTAIIGLITILISLSAYASEDSKGLTGVWSGKLGKSEIRVCFNSEGNTATYYYKRYNNPITVNLQNGHWIESGNSGRWHIGKINDNKITGTWHTINSKTKTLPLSLNFDYVDEKDECGGDDFITPLLHTPIWRKDKWMNWFGWRYRNLYYGAFETIEFDQNFPSSTVINKALRNYVSNDKSVNEQHRNIKSSLRFGRLGYDETSVLPVFMNALWLGVHFYNWRYGTGTNGINYHTTYFSLHDGHKINPWHWFIESSDNLYKEDYAYKLPKAIADKYENEHEDRSNCREGIHGYYQIKILNDGFYFFERSYGDGCERDFHMKAKDALIYANVEGQKQINNWLALMKLNRN